MSNDTAAALRRLAELVEKDPSITAMVEVETIGRMVKTSVVLWSVAPGAVVEPPKPEVRWCQARRMTATGSAACGALLATDGTCGKSSYHITRPVWR